MRLRLRFLSSTALAGAPVGRPLGRGVALRGRVWPGGGLPAYDGGLVVVGPHGRVTVAGRDTGSDPADGLLGLGGAGAWVGPGLVDAHVHLAFGVPGRVLAGGVVAVRDLGAPPRLAAAVSGTGPPAVAVAGPVVTAPGGYPGATWGAGGFAAYAGSPRRARSLVASLAADGVDLVKVALEPGGGAPVPGPAVLRALVDAAHAAELPVTAHALTAAMVAAALDAGVDELCHTPTELLPPALLDRVAAAGVAVVSTLQALAAAGDGAAAGVGSNATALHAAGVRLLYGTDLGNTGTRPGADPAELGRLADAGLGAEGALRAAVETGTAAVGMSGPPGRIAVGQPAALVLLPGDPLRDPAVWRSPLAVLAGGRLLLPT